MDPTIADVNTSSSSSEATSNAGANATDAKTGADSSTAQPATTQPKGLEEFLENALKEREAEPAKTEAEETTTETETEKPEGEEQTEETETETEEEKAKPEADKGPIPYERFAEVNNAKVQAEATIKQLLPLAETFKTIDAHCQRYNISDQEFAYWMDVAALSKIDPVKAKQMLLPTLQQMDTFTGDLLPADLRTAVDEGKLTEEYAKELSKARNQEKFAQQQVQQTRQQQALQQQQQYQEKLYTSLENWQTRIAKTDLEFVPKADPSAPDGKFELFVHKFALDAKSVSDKSIENLLAVADKAYQSVNASVKKFGPKLNGNKVLRSTQSTSTTAPAPKTLEEVIARGAAKFGIVASTRK